MPERFEPADLLVIERGARHMLALEERIEKAELSKKVVNDKLGTLEIAIRAETKKLVKTLFDTDRSIAHAIKKVDAQRKNVAKSGGVVPRTVNFAGQTISFEELDPKRVIEQRDLTDMELASVRNIHASLDELDDRLSALIATLNSEILLVKSFSRKVEVLLNKMQTIANKGGPEARRMAQDELESIRHRLAEASRSVDELRKTRRQVVAVKRMTTKAMNFAGRVRKRVDAETLLMMLAGGGAVLSVLAAILGSTVVGGVIALPAILAFGASKLLEMIRIFKTGGDK